MVITIKVEMGKPATAARRPDSLVEVPQEGKLRMWVGELLRQC